MMAQNTFTVFCLQSFQWTFTPELDKEKQTGGGGELSSGSDLSKYLWKVAFPRELFEPQKQNKQTKKNSYTFWIQHEWAKKIIQITKSYAFELKLHPSIHSCLQCHLSQMSFMAHMEVLALKALPCNKWKEKRYLLSKRCTSGLQGKINEKHIFLLLWIT